MWWIYQSSRFYSEKATLKDLEGRSNWLHVKTWHASDIQKMCVEFEITLSDEVFAFRMLYPSVFPDAPPMIYPKNHKRISSHQYAEGGELCLEYRPDNWEPNLTGADMVTSCYNLLLEESSVNGKDVVAHSAHVPSLGRDLRMKSCRLLLTPADIDALNKLNKNSFEAIHLCEETSRASGNSNSYISSIKHIGEQDSIKWKSDLVRAPGNSSYSGVVVRITSEMELKYANVDTLRELLTRNGLSELISLLLDVPETTKLLIGDDHTWYLFWIFGEKAERKALSYETVILPPEQKRLVDELRILGEKKVGIVGCGSVGSKIAASLCRTGVGKFLLIDEDVLFPANVVRNELTLKDIGCHKSYALKNHLNGINPNCDVVALRLLLGGQESAESMTGALESLGCCDLLIDATGDSKAFNFISSVSRRQKKPMIWAEVFSGGIGGLIARSRPNLDPLAIYAKQQIEAWCNEKGIDWNRQSNSVSYEGFNSEGQPMIADDSEVSIISMHTARFVIDALVRPQESIFPVSAYFIGLNSDWIFSQPFDTWPIQLTLQGDWGEIFDPLSEEALLNLINEHLPPRKNSNEDSDSQENS